MRLIPDTIVSRTLLVLIAGLMVSHALSAALYLGDRETALVLAGGDHIADRIAMVLRFVEGSSATERRRIIEVADSPVFHVAWSQEPVVAAQQENGWWEALLTDAMTAHLGREHNPAFRLAYTEPVAASPWEQHMQGQHNGTPLGQALMVSLELPDASWLNFAAAVQPQAPSLSFRFGLSMAVMLVAVVVFSVWVGRYLTIPLSIFARAAQRLGVDVKAPALPEDGPGEVREAASAFNRMQDRIRRFVDDRTQMIAAISHDLGTPITRLRLRAEFIDNDEERTKMLADLDEMEKMVVSALSFARDEAVHEPRAMVDLKTLVQRVCDDLTDAGNSVTLAVDNDALPYNCLPVALRRALTNLIENAVKYGFRARVSMGSTEHRIWIRIDDDGPGIPEALQDDAFKPFRRLEASRNRDTGGTGLGLTVARSIIRAHGGDVILENRGKGGLRVNVVLPR